MPRATQTEDLTDAGRAIRDEADRRRAEFPGEEPTPEELTATERATQAAANDAELSEALDHEVVGWKPAEGDKVIGNLITRYRTIDKYRTAQAGGVAHYYWILEIQTAPGDTIGVHCFHTVLATAIDRFDPQPGDKVAISYLGRITQGGAMNDGYENYRMIVRKPKPVGS